MLSNEDAERFRKRAIIAATACGFGEHAEDLAQEVLLSWASGRGQHQTVDQAVVDAIRARFGRPGKPGYAARYALETADTIDDPERPLTIVAPEGRSDEPGIDIRRALECVLGERTREVLRLRFEEDLLLEEIAERFGVTASRINHLITEGCADIRRAIKRGELEVDVEMETRTCACGCGQTFRVANISNQRYASLEHEALVTPGGMNEVRKRTAKKAARARLIPKDATGQVGSMELAKILGISYQTLFHWMKSGKIRPLSGTERNKVFDIAQVRIQLGQETGEPEAAAPALEATDASLSERIEALPEYEPAPEETTEPTEPTSEESEPEHEETEMTQEHVEENTEELLSASEAAAELGISVASVYNWTKSGRLIGTAVGNKTQFSAAAVAAAKSAEEKSEEAPAKALAPKRVKKMRRKKKTAEIGILVRFKMSAGDYLYRNRNLFLGTMIGVGVTRLFMMMHH